MPLFNRRGQRLHGLDPQRVVDSKTAGLVERELRKRTDPVRLRRALGDLRKGGVFRPAANAVASRLETLLTELPRMMAAKGGARRNGLRHLFDRAEDARAYLRSTQELRTLLQTREGAQLLKSAAGRLMLDQHATQLFQDLAHVSDSYGVLKEETGLFNDLINLLHPKDYPSLRLDAHHVVEERAFELFRGDWELLGWTKPEDMAAIPVLYEFHIRSPKRLPGIGDLARDLDARSLTRELIKQVDPTRAPDAFALLKSYKAYYAKGGLRRAVPVIEAIEKELSKQRTAARLVRELKRRAR